MRIALKDTPQTSPNPVLFRYILARATMWPRGSWSTTPTFQSYAQVRSRSLFAILTSLFLLGNLRSRSPGQRLVLVAQDLPGRVRTIKDIQVAPHVPVQALRIGIRGKVVTLANGIPTGRIRIGAALPGPTGNLKMNTIDYKSKTSFHYSMLFQILDCLEFQFSFQLFPLFCLPWHHVSRNTFISYSLVECAH